MPNITTTFRGRVVALNSRDYNGFTDEVTGRQVLPGTTTSLWVLQDDKSEPVLVKVPRDLAPSLVEFGKPEAFGCPVLIEADVITSGRRNDTTLRLVHLQVVEAAKLKSA